MHPELVPYYNARAAEYERVYDKPERQDDLRQLHELIPSLLAGRSVLEVACGTGYWTRRISARAAAITGCDLAGETLTLARALQPAEHAASYVAGDAYALTGVPGCFDAAFVGFWWSHIRHADLRRFLGGLNARLPVASRVVILDNRYVAGSNWPVTRTDEDGNTYQQRQLENGTRHEVLKNFPSAAEVLSAIELAGGVNPRVHELQYFWYATYETT